MFAIKRAPWLPSCTLEIACQLETQDPLDCDDALKGILEELDEHHIKPEVRVTRQFQSNVCLFILSEKPC